MARPFTIFLGVVLLLVGIVGAVTGGHDHNLIVFGVNMNHNLVHILSGALGILMAMGGEGPARLFCLLFGSVYGLVAVLGFLGVESVVRLLNLNMADNVLHAAIAAACLIVGARSRAPAAAPR